MRTLILAVSTSVALAGRRLVAASIVVAALWAPSLANAAVRTATITLNPNSTGASFQPTNYPLAPVTFSYDDQSGTLTITEGGGQLQPVTPGELDVYDLWPDLGNLDIGNCVNTPGPSTSADLQMYLLSELQYVDPDGTLAAAPAFNLTASEVSGNLLAVATASADGSTLTETWTSPLIAGENLTCITGLTSAPLYFNGYAPGTPAPAATPPTKPIAKPKPKPSALPTLLGSTRYANQGSKLLVKPLEIVYTGDGSGILGGFARTSKRDYFGQLKWSSWTHTQATASGAVWLDNCNPDCAQGTFFPFPVTIVAFQPSAGHFTRLTLRFRMKGKVYVDKRAIVKQQSSYYYNFAPGFLPK